MLISTILVERAIERDGLWERFNADDRRALTPSFHSHINPYGQFAISFLELRQLLPRRKAEAVMAALWVANIAEAEHALSAPLNNAEAIYKANLEMKAFHQEVVRGRSCGFPAPLHHEARCFQRNRERIRCTPSRNPAAGNRSSILRFRPCTQPSVGIREPFS
jgi:hypothetical protein